MSHENLNVVQRSQRSYFLTLFELIRCPKKTRIRSLCKSSLLSFPCVLGLNSKTYYNPAQRDQLRVGRLLFAQPQGWGIQTSPILSRTSQIYGSPTQLFSQDRLSLFSVNFKNSCPDMDVQNYAGISFPTFDTQCDTLL